jgi:hypothetical protein
VKASQIAKDLNDYADLKFGKEIAKVVDEAIFLFAKKNLSINSFLRFILADEELSEHLKLDSDAFVAEDLREEE